MKPRISKYHWCDSCGKYDENIIHVEIGDPPDYNSNTSAICKECLLEALSLLKEKEE